MFNPNIKSMTPVLVPPHSYPVLFLDTGCQMYRRGADKPDVQCGQRKTYCKGTFFCCPFQEILSLFFFFALSVPPTGRDRLEESADCRQETKCCICCIKIPWQQTFYVTERFGTSLRYKAEEEADKDEKILPTNVEKKKNQTECSQINCYLYKWCESLSSRYSTCTWIYSEFFCLSNCHKFSATLNCWTG